jgi:2-oxoglutarate dehydrogenase E1 component
MELSYYGWSEQAIDKKLYVDLPHYGGLLDKKQHWTMRELIDPLRNAYCGKIGVEFMHIPDREQCNWIRDKVELRQYDTLSVEERETILSRILETDEFHTFISTKFNTLKRFGLEGCESLIPGMKAAMDAIR